MYIRQPWVVGNAGVLGAILIVLLSVAITGATALSLSSIVTNGKIGAGGAFSVISQSLGLEIGGAIGIPFYIAQAIAVAMYIFGFREGLQMLLPEYNALLLDAITFVLVMGIAFISTSFAFKIQYVILVIIVLSLVSIFGSLFTNELYFNYELLGKFPGSVENGFKGSSFWVVFAVYFPAVTGVMAGANMSGDLTNPRKSIPFGTLSAVVLTTIIYIALCIVAGLLATPNELVSNYTIFIEKSVFPPIVLAGLLGATLSSALGSFVGAPRILLALGEKGILPKSKMLSKTDKKGEPINAMLVTAIVVIIGISLRDLNTIAPLLTMFFMITYAMVNVVALVEQSLGLPSYRPSMKIHILIPLLGTFGSLVVMFIMNAVVALVSLVLIVLFYFYLSKKKLKSDSADSRSGLFTALAEWATKKTTELNQREEPRTWRPDLLIPLSSPRELRSSFRLIESIVSPKGSIKMITLKNENVDEQKALDEFVPHAIAKFRDFDIPITYSSVQDYELNNSMNITMQALSTSFFKPNTVFVAFDSNETGIMNDKKVKLIKDVIKNQYGLIVYIPYKTASLSIQKNVSLWVRDLPIDWKENFEYGNNDLSTLLSILISKNWDANLSVNIIKPTKFESDDKSAFFDLIRLPKHTNINVVDADILSALKEEKKADLNIVPISKEASIEEMIEIVNKTRISGLFCYDSGRENAFV